MDVDRLRTYALLATGMAIFGSATPVAAIVTRAFPVLLATELRLAVAALVLAVAAAATGRLRLPEGMARRDWLLVGGIALFGTVLFSLLMLEGMARTSGAVGGVVMATTPAVTAIGSLLFGERLGRWRLAGIGLAVVGVGVVNVFGGVEGGGATSLLGVALVFGAVCGEAAYTLLGKQLTANVAPLIVALLAALVGAAMFVPFALVDAGRLDPATPSPTDWLALLWWGAGIMGLGSVLWYRGVMRVPGSVAAGFMGVMPVSAIVLSYVLLGEQPRLIHLVGGAIVILGILLIARSHGAGDEDGAQT